MEDELKRKAEFYLKQVMDTSKAATKTAFVSFAALAIIWATQIRPGYDRLVDYVYPSLPRLTEELKTETQKRDSLRKDFSDMKVSPRVDQSGNQLVAIESDRAKRNKSEKVDRQEQLVKLKRSELENAVSSIGFDIFGLKIPVKPLFAAVVWNLVLLTVLFYLARARSLIWALCANALFALKRSGRHSDALDDIAGEGPLWLAPAPARPGREEVVTKNDLLSAFGWNHLDTLPSIAATIGFLLLSLLQLAVTAQGFQVIKSAREFTTTLITEVNPTNNTRTERPDLLERRIASIASALVQPDAQGTPDQNPTTPYDLQRDVRSLTLGKFLGSLISLVLLLSLVGTLSLVVWWFRPARVSGRLAGYTATPQQRAKLLLLVAVVISICLLFSRVQPIWGLSFGETLADTLPVLTKFVGGAIISFCLVELAILALIPPTATAES